MTATVEVIMSFKVLDTQLSSLTQDVIDLLLLFLFIYLYVSMTVCVTDCNTQGDQKRA